MQPLVTLQFEGFVLILILNLASSRSHPGSASDGSEVVLKHLSREAPYQWPGLRHFAGETCLCPLPLEFSVVHMASR